MKRTYFTQSPYFKTYEFLGLKGRYGHWPAKNATAKRTFVLIYGQHATLERLLPIAEAMRDFGDVYLADNPGFGGMDPGYKIKRYPNLDFYAEHLKHFIEDYIPPDRKITLLGISFGFQMAATMLANYPEIQNRIEDTISFVGFVNPGDFKISKTTSIPLLYILANSGRTWLGSKIYTAILRENFIVFCYHLTRPIQEQFKNLHGEDADRYAREQAWLWIVNDPRTHGSTGWDLFRKNDLTGLRIPMDVIHVGVPNDHFFDNSRVAVELKKIFRKTYVYDLQLANHAPLDIETPEKVRGLLPPKLVKTLQSSRNRKAVKA
jgi:pimeloyl-ACP methyl ester carboxylesterase